MKKNTLRSAITLTSLCSLIAIAGIVTFVNSCTKHKHECGREPLTEQTSLVARQPLQQNVAQSKIVTIANIRQTTEGTEVMFNELAQLFTVEDAGVVSDLQAAFSANKAVNVKFDPWSGLVKSVNAISAEQAAARQSRVIVTNTGTSYSVSLANNDDNVINTNPALAVLNTTTTGLTNVIPDMATAQSMFNYITKQCCATAGPYAIDYCISFQYCQDGCYARAHKMCWILNNTFHYGTHKIFSFANSGSDRLRVQCQKWGGCCVSWWYHVAPLVNIKTPTGVKAYVFDPAMFDQPVLLATWLHAQENPTCGTSAHVTMINIQPTTSYSPASYSGMSFDTDPMYYDTNTTLSGYSPLHTCP